MENHDKPNDTEKNEENTPLQEPSETVETPPTAEVIENEQEDDENGAEEDDNSEEGKKKRKRGNRGGANNGQKSKEVEEDLTKANAELAEMKDKYLRLYAEFDNYRKRTSKERLDLIKTASQDALKAFLPVLDDFERAIKAAETGGERRGHHDE